MTEEELRKKLLGGTSTVSENTKEATTYPTLYTTKDLLKKVTETDPAEYRLTLQALGTDPKVEAYNNARKTADANYESLMTTKKEAYEKLYGDAGNERNLLTDSYKEWQDQTTKAIQNSDLEGYYTGMLMQQKIKNQLKDTSTLGDYIGDFQKNAETSLLSAIYNIEDFTTQAITKLQSDALDPIALKYVNNPIKEGMVPQNLKKPYGTYSNFLNTQNESVSNLEQLYKSHPDDAKIAELYNYIKNGAKLTKGTLEGLTDYANGVYRTDAYKSGRNPNSVLEEKRYEDEKLKEMLSWDGLAKGILDTESTVVNMVPSIVAASATGGAGAIPSVAQAVSLATLGAGAAGQATNQKINEGYGFDPAFNYGLGVGAFEAGSEVLGGENVNSLLFGNISKTPIGKVVSKAVEKAGIKGKFGKAVAGLVSNVGGEMTEEALTAAIDPIWGSLTLGEDIDPKEYIEGIYKDAIAAIPSTLVLMGFGQAQVMRTVNATQKSLVDQITKSTAFSNNEKAMLIRQIQEVTQDAKLGLTENYDDVVNAVYAYARMASAQNQAINNNVQQLQQQYGLSEAGANLAREELGYVNNQEKLTTQEILDMTEPIEVKYSGMNTINKEINEMLNADPKVKSARIQTNINKMQENIGNIIEKLTGKQVVYVDMQADGETVYGFTNPTNSNNIYINSNQNTLNTLGASYHEIGHHYKIQYPELYKAFKNTANLGNMSEYDIEERFGNYVGQIMTKAENVKAIDKSTKSMFEKLKDIGNQVANKTLGAERNNTNISAYNLDNTSYLGEDVLNNKDLEQLVLNTFKSLKPVNQVKEVAKTTEKITKKAEDTKAKSTSNSNLEKRYAQMKKDGKTKPVEVKRMIAEELGKKYNDLKKDPEIESVYRDLVGGKLTETGTKFSKKENPRDQIINNQRGEIDRLSEKNEKLEAENKGLKKINAGIKSTGRQRIREVQRESNKMLKVGRETEQRLKAKNERQVEKFNRLATAAINERYENQFLRKAAPDNINYGREYKDLFIGLRRSGMSIEKAYELTKSIYEDSQRVNKAIDTSMNILKDLRKKNIYNKLPNELKEKIDAYDKIWIKSRQQSSLTLAKRILTSETLKEYLGKIAMTNSIKNQIMNYDGSSLDGKGTISLKELFDGSIELAEKFASGLEALRNEVKEFSQRDMLAERTKELRSVTDKVLEQTAKEIETQGAQKIRQFIKKFTNKTLANSQMTLKTEIQAVMGGNANAELMEMNTNLQDGEVRRKQAIVDMYEFLENFKRKAAGLNRLIGVEKWNKDMEKSLAVNAAWIDTGLDKLPRAAKSFIMSLAMHLKNDQNMLHISGGIVRITTDNEGKTTVVEDTGGGVRVPNESLYRRGKINDAYDKGKTVKLTYDEVQQLVDLLTDEEKAFVDAVTDIYAYSTKLINEVSNRMYGYDIATVENYFPIHTWRNGVPRDALLKNVKADQMGQLDALSYLTNAGWLQERVTSFAPVYLENIAEVLNRSMNNTATFYGYAEALRDNNIILNSEFADDGIQVGDGEKTKTLREALGYLSSDFIKDYNKLARYIVGAESNRSMDTFRNFMAQNTLTFNIGTWFTQPASFFNTLKYYSTKDFLKGINPVANNLILNNKIRNYYAELGIDTSQISSAQLARMFIAEATPNLDYRAINYKMAGIDKLLSKSINDKLGVKGIQLFDDIAVTAIARMQAYILSLDPSIEFGSEEYFKRLGANLTQVLVETQPETSQVNRANMFRSTNALTRALSLFGTPANQILNNVMQSTMDLRYQLREGNKQEIKRATQTFTKSITGVITSSISVALIRAIRDSIRAKDDDDTEFEDRVIAQLIVAMLSPTVIGDDIASYIMANNEYGGASSFDFSTPDTTFVNGIQNLANALKNLTNENVSPTKRVVSVVKALGTVTPVDTRSLVRIAEATMKFLAPDTYTAYSLQNDSTIYKKWLENSDTDMAEFYKAYKATRDKTLAEKYGYHKANKELKIESNLKESRQKALEDVFPNDKKKVEEYMEILFNYKTQ